MAKMCSPSEEGRRCVTSVTKVSFSKMLRMKVELVLEEMWNCKGRRGREKTLVYTVKT